MAVHVLAAAQASDAPLLEGEGAAAAAAPGVGLFERPAGGVVEDGQGRQRAASVRRRLDFSLVAQQGVSGRGRDEAGPAANSYASNGTVETSKLLHEILTVVAQEDSASGAVPEAPGASVAPAGGFKV